MSRNKHKKQEQRRKQNQTPAPNLPVLAPLPTPCTPPATTVQSETDKAQDRRINWSLAVAVVSLAVSFGSVIFAYRSAKEAAEANTIARAAQDRATGKVQASFEFTEEKNRDPNRFKEFMRQKDGYDQTVFRIESVDELVRWGPHVRIKNTGTDPIDAIRTEVAYLFGSAYGMGVKQIEPIPIVYNEPTSHEATSFGKLMPGQTAKISLAPLFLGQMSRLKWEDYPDKDHIGIFSVNVSCRLVGSTSYDRIQDKQPLVFTFHWRPAGFKADAKNVKELLELKPSVEIQ